MKILKKLRKISEDTIYTFIAALILCGFVTFIITVIVSSLFVIPYILIILFFIWIFNIIRTH